MMNTLPIFKKFPRLQKEIPYIELGLYPTPVERLDLSEFAAPGTETFIKRDDITALKYGGNKVRKLEFLFGKALQLQAKEVCTIGFAGSNHALATAVYADQLGLKSTSLLMRQKNAHYVRDNLIASFYCNAALRHYRNALTLLTGIASKKFFNKIKLKTAPYLIPAGGSCPLGVLGYINALLELVEQIEKGEIPEPDYIYLPLGSGGTSIGLAIGASLCGLKTKIVAVRVIENKFLPARSIFKLARKTVSFLRDKDPEFPDAALEEHRFLINNDFLGDGYASFSEEGKRATRIMHQQHNLTLNGTYSAKAFAAMLQGIEEGMATGKRVLFWNTYNSRDLSLLTPSMDYRQLPKRFWPYFEEDVQLFDSSDGKIF